MRKFAGSVLAFVVFVFPLWADQPAGKIVDESRYAARVGGSTIGSSHTTVREVERDGSKLFITTVELKLNLQRQGEVVHLGMETGSEETADGKVSKLWMKHFQEGQLALRMDCVVGGNEIEISVAGPNPSARKVPWDPQVIGLFRQDKIYQDKKVKPGDTFSFVTFEPVFSGIITHKVTVKAYVELALAGAKKQRLLRVEEVPDKVAGPQGMIQLPGSTNWLDERLRIACTESEVPGIGKMRFYRTNRTDIPLGAAPELLTMIPLNRTINRPNETRSAVYRITLKGDQDPGSAFVSDDRQATKDLGDNTFELQVQASSGPRNVADPGAVKEDFTKSCYYIDCDDALVQKLARQAVGDATDPWAKARRIERWVRGNMTVDFKQDFSPASKIARRRSGDCRQHAILAAAMCRAADVPSRTAIGLVYDGGPMQNRPGMFFHMWTEVWVKGQWLAIDATRGEGHVGATHLKITDCSWHNETSLRPLLPVLRVTDKDKLSIKVVRVDYAD